MSLCIRYQATKDFSQKGCTGRQSSQDICQCAPKALSGHKTLLPPWAQGGIWDPCDLQRNWRIHPARIYVKGMQGVNARKFAHANRNAAWRLTQTKMDQNDAKMTELQCLNERHTSQIQASKTCLTCNYCSSLAPIHHARISLTRKKFKISWKCRPSRSIKRLP